MANTVASFVKRAPHGRIMTFTVRKLSTLRSCVSRCDRSMWRKCKAPRGSEREHRKQERSQGSWQTSGPRWDMENPDHVQEQEKLMTDKDTFWKEDSCDHDYQECYNSCWESTHWRPRSTMLHISGCRRELVCAHRATSTRDKLKDILISCMTKTARSWHDNRIFRKQIHSHDYNVVEDQFDFGVDL